MGLLPDIFRIFITKLWPLIDVRISFLLNIFRTNGQNFTKFVYALVLTRSTCFFCKLAPELLWPLIDVY